MKINNTPRSIVITLAIFMAGLYLLTRQSQIISVIGFVLYGSSCYALGILATLHYQEEKRKQQEKYI